MKLSWLWTLGGLALLASAAWSPPKPSARWAVILGGDTDGYLSPCGCTQPMTGGLRRRATATRELGFGTNTLVLDNGSLVAGTSRQDEMKAQTAAEALRSIGVSGINFGAAEAALGQGMALSLQSLAGERFASASVERATVPLASFVQEGPFLAGFASSRPELVAPVTGGIPISTDRVVTTLLEQAKETGKTAILLLQGNHAEASALAKTHPGLGLIQYRSSGDPPDHPERVGNTLLATVGERGKSLVRLVWDGSKFSGYTAVHLGPQFSDDPRVSSIFRNYLARVDNAGLLAQVPRHATGAFAGTAACAPCHASAMRVWKGTAHARSLATLENRREGRDPDCVPCHVTRLDSLSGFRSRATTPQLAFVGCESCHGPALAHAKQPSIARLPTVGGSACAPCHTSLNSPSFDFPSYWARIRH